MQEKLEKRILGWETNPREFFILSLIVEVARNYLNVPLTGIFSV